MTKTENKKSIKISKLAFLDEMLEFPTLKKEYPDYGVSVDRPDFALESPTKFEELIKTIAAKTLTEEELLAVLGDKQRINLHGKPITYTA